MGQNDEDERIGLELQNNFNSSCQTFEAFMKHGQLGSTLALLANMKRIIDKSKDNCNPEENVIILSIQYTEHNEMKKKKVQVL